MLAARVAWGAAWDAWFLLSRPHPIVRYYSRILRFGAVVGLMPFLAVMVIDFLFGGAVPLLPFSVTTIVYALVQAYLAVEPPAVGLYEKVEVLAWYVMRCQAKTVSFTEPAYPDSPWSWERFRDLRQGAEIWLDAFEPPQQIS